MLLFTFDSEQRKDIIDMELSTTLGALEAEMHLDRAQYTPAQRSGHVAFDAEVGEAEACINYCVRKSHIPAFFSLLTNIPAK